MSTTDYRGIHLKIPQMISLLAQLESCRLIVFNNSYYNPTLHLNVCSCVSLTSFHHFSKIRNWQIEKYLTYADYRLKTFGINYVIQHLSKTKFKSKCVFLSSSLKPFPEPLQQINFCIFLIQQQLYNLIESTRSSTTY